jgi:hypothetical protein
MFGGVRRRRAALVVVLVLTAGAVVASLPAHRKIGVNFVVTDHTLPLWIKAVDFVDRDVNFAQTARQVLSNADGDEARTMTALEWTRAHVKDQPDGLPIVDDHVWHVIIRGYGEPDQQADVFTTLLVYEGVPAYWMLTGTSPEELPLSYVFLHGQWRVFDAGRGIVFRTASGMLATPEDLATDASLVEASARGRVEDMARYLEYFRRYQPPQPPDVLRADLQMPGRRALYEMKRLVGLGGRVWQIRPDVGGR